MRYPPSLSTVAGEMSATIVTPGMCPQRIAHGGETRCQKLQAVMRQQHDLGLSAKPRANVICRRFRQNFAGQILRRVQHRRRRRRHDRTHIGARAMTFFKARRQRRRIDRRHDHRARLIGRNVATCLIISTGSLLAKATLIAEAPRPRRGFQPASRALHEFAPVVLHEYQLFLQTSRRFAGRPCRIVCGQFDRRGQPLAARGERSCR